MPKFKEIDREVDGRIVRQTFVKPLVGGCLVLVSTTIYMAHTMPNIKLTESERYKIMVVDVPIESVSESVVFVEKSFNQLCGECIEEL